MRNLRPHRCLPRGNPQDRTASPVPKLHRFCKLHIPSISELGLNWDGVIRNFLVHQDGKEKPTNVNTDNFWEKTILWF
ncbi:hypothetical protein BI334_06930 [Moorena producens 3L]|nr:hypothetical protein BI334_06930 [Moorena producens 3L]